MGMLRRSARRAGRRAGRRSALITTAVIGGAMAASSNKRQAAENQAAEAEKAQAEQIEQVTEDVQKQALVDPVQRLKERLANGEITLEDFNKMMDAIK